jgi:DNA-nicking Smr family endonuclease
MPKRATKTGAANDEAELFRMSIGDVTPLARPAKVMHRRPQPHPLPLQRLNDDREALRESLSDWTGDADFETGEELSFVRDGIGAHTLRKLRRGHWVIQDELDLHGLIVPDARELLVEFLALCARRGLRCVRVIHGKGLRSKNGQPVLKQKVAKWLMQRDEILAYCQARRTEGGGGAVVVLLKG